MNGVMLIRLHLGGVQVAEVVLDTLTELVVGVVSAEKLSSCPCCGRSCRRVASTSASDSSAYSMTRRCRSKSLAPRPEWLVGCPRRALSM